MTQAKVVARGRRSEILDWGAGKVLKLYLPGWRAEAVAGEAEATRVVHGLGIPCPAVYGTVELDGRHGIIFERVDGPSAGEVLARQPEQGPELARLLAELHAAMHSRTAPEGPRQRDFIRRKVLNGRSPLPDAEKRAVVEVLDSLPDGDAVCHGDFHVLNVLLPAGRGPVIIDWDSPSLGNALCDVARTVLIGSAAPLHAEPAAAAALGRLARSVVAIYLRRYFELRAVPRLGIGTWLWINAAARLCEGIAEEQEWLLALTRRGLEGLRGAAGA